MTPGADRRERRAHSQGGRGRLGPASKIPALREQYSSWRAPTIPIGLFQYMPGRGLRAEDWGTRSVARCTRPAASRVLLATEDDSARRAGLGRLVLGRRRRRLGP